MIKVALKNDGPAKKIDLKEFERLFEIDYYPHLVYLAASCDPADPVKFTR